MTEWQPIETAPRDGTSILVAGGNYEFDSDQFGDKYPMVHADVVYWRSGFIDGWCSGYDEPYGDYIWVVEPTHWQPLPPPPSE